MYRELLIFPPKLKGQPMYPDTARSLVAKACDGKSINPQIFCREPDGKSIQRVFGHTADGEGFGATPSVCFGGGNGLVRLYGIGAAGSALVMTEATNIAGALASHFGDSACSIKINTSTCELSPRDSQAYRIRNLIVAKKRYQFAKIAEKGLPNLAEMTPLIKSAIFRGLVGQAMMLDEETGSNLEFSLPREESLDIQVFEGQPVFVPIKQGSRPCALGVHNLVFTMNLKLDGPWFVGHLRSRGFGLLQGGKMVR